VEEDTARLEVVVSTVQGAIQEFLRRKPGWSRTVVSDSEQMLSYATKVAYWENGVIKVRRSGANNLMFYSRTTNRHLNMLIGMATDYGIQIEDEGSKKDG
jgi:uncharacterized protein YcnI